MSVTYKVTLMKLFNEIFSSKTDNTESITFLISHYISHGEIGSRVLTGKEIARFQ